MEVVCPLYTVVYVSDILFCLKKKNGTTTIARHMCYVVQRQKKNRAFIVLVFFYLANVNKNSRTSASAAGLQDDRGPLPPRVPVQPEVALVDVGLHRHRMFKDLFSKTSLIDKCIILTWTSPRTVQSL